MTTTTAYREGYHKGRHWQRDHMPGGPFVHDEKSRQINADWLTGFRAGLRKSLYKELPGVLALITTLPDSP